MDRRRRAARTVALMSLFTTTDTRTDVPIASFVGDGSDLVSLSVAIEPVQDLNGYDNPWPAGGGANKFNGVSPKSISSPISYTANDDASIITLTSLSQSYSYAGAAFDISYLIGKTVYISASKNSSAQNLGYLQIRYVEDGVTKYIDIGTTVNPSTPRTITASASSASFHIMLKNSSGAGEIGDYATYTNLIIAEEPNPTFAPYSNICPISGWTEAKIWVKSTHDTSATPTATIQLGETVYGGTLDVTTGKLTVDRANIASYNGETLTGRWISDRDVYSAGTTPTIGAQVVYELATPIVYDLRPTQVTTLIGTNNIWADTGDIKYIEYNI